MFFFLTLSLSMLSTDVWSLILRSLFHLFMGPGRSFQGNLYSPASSPCIMEGTFSLGTSTNFDAYLSELGVNFILRNLAKLAKPTVSISRNCPRISCQEELPVSSTLSPLTVNCSSSALVNCTSNKIDSKDENCEWTIYTYTPFKSHSIIFRLNKQVVDKTMDGRYVTSFFSIFNSTTLIENQVGYVNTTLIRTFNDDEMQVSLYANQVMATSSFSRTKKLKSSSEIRIANPG